MEFYGTAVRKDGKKNGRVKGEVDGIHYSVGEASFAGFGKKSGWYHKDKKTLVQPDQGKWLYISGSASGSNYTHQIPTFEAYWLGPLPLKPIAGDLPNDGSLKTEDKFKVLNTSNPKNPTWVQAVLSNDDKKLIALYIKNYAIKNLNKDYKNSDEYKPKKLEQINKNYEDRIKELDGIPPINDTLDGGRRKTKRSKRSKKTKRRSRK
jgi:hypothetical protein